MSEALKSPTFLIRVPSLRGARKCRAFDAEPLGPPEQVSVLVVCAASRAIKRGVTSRGAYEVERAVGHVDENGQVAPASRCSPSRMRTDPTAGIWAIDLRVSFQAFGV